MKQLFDKEIRDAIREENISVPSSVHLQTERLLNALPERRTKVQHHAIPSAFSRIAIAAACILFVLLALLPNVSVAYAHALEDIPVIGDLVEIFTIRNYFYSDDRHELDVDVPSVYDPDNGQASDLINKNVNELTNAVIQRFYSDLEINHDKGYGSIYIDYGTVTNTNEWFTLKLTVSELAASSNTYFRYYHIDRTNGEYVTFGDLFELDDFAAIELLIREQMKAEMADPEIVYWIEETDIGQSITVLDDEQNFYFNESGDLVIAYNKYEVGPGSMGCPEIVISKEQYRPYMIPHYIELLGLE